DPQERQSVIKSRVRANNEIANARVVMAQADQDLKWLTLKAPRDGVIMGLPLKDEVGRRWDNKEQGGPFCTIGDPTKLRVWVPLPPSDYDLVRDNLARLKGTQGLPVTIRVQGRAAETWTGQITKEGLPEQEAKEIPFALSSKSGGPLAAKPTTDPNHIAPQAQ